MALLDAYLAYWHQSFDYSKRSSRQYYLFAISGNIILFFVLILLLSSIQEETQLFSIIESAITFFSIAVIIPQVSITVRRLRDIGQDPKWALILFIPILGPIAIFIWLAFRPSWSGWIRQLVVTTVDEMKSLNRVWTGFSDSF